MSDVRVSPLTPAIGAVVEGVDLRRMDAETFERVHTALLDRQVLFFRDQHLTDEEHVAVASAWGEPMVFPVAQLLGGKNVLGRIVDDESSPPDADGWHTDVSWWPEPPKVAVLCAIQIPESGGDTMWSSLYTAYDSLSEPMKRICESLEVFHHPGERFIEANARVMGEEAARIVTEQCRGTVMPLVRTHDETGRQALYLSGGFMDHVVGMHRPESDALLGFLMSGLDDPNRSVRWRWREGDVAIWDERSTVHRALSDHYPRRREMRRCTVQGPKPELVPSS